jgi:predicted NBD/HSP70 family sugar kinase
MPHNARWGIDLGGTKIEGIVISSETPQRVICRERIATEGSSGYDHVLSRIKQLTDTMIAITGNRPEVIGFGTPGTLDPDTGTLRGSNSIHLNGQSLDRDLEHLLGVPVILENDANCFALAETRVGIVPEVCPRARVVIGLIMGTGVGSGIVIDGNIVSGRHSIAGEWGHNFLDESGGPCF